MPSSKITIIAPSRTTRSLIILVPPVGWPGFNFRELWAYRGLLWLFWWRDLRQRYARPMLGIGWAAIQPLFALGLLTLVFGQTLGFTSPSGSYLSSSACALMAWQLFSSAAMSASESVVNNDYLIRSVYFPRLWLPLSRVLGKAVDASVSWPLLMLVIVAAGQAPHWRWLLLPLLLVWTLVLALGTALIFDAFIGHKRVFRHFLAPFFTGLLLISPVAYSASAVPEAWRSIYEASPIVALIETFRWVLVGGTGISGFSLVAGLSVTVLCLLIGIVLHRYLEARFSDEMA